MIEKVEIHFDGGVKNKVFHYGVIAKDMATQCPIYIEYNKINPETGVDSTNCAEYFGLLKALKWIFETEELLPAKQYIVYGDSDIVINQMLGKYEVGDNLEYWNKACNSYLEEIDTNVHFRWCNRIMNNEADFLVNLSKCLN